jgi:hypothetical protein
MGRFTRSDVYEGNLSHPITLNRFLYTNSNPVNGIDPTGFITAYHILAASAIIATLYAATIPGISNSLTLGRASTREFDSNNEVLVDIYSWAGAPWGHASLNVDGTVYNQGGTERPESSSGSSSGGFSGMLWGQGYFIREPQSAWYDRLQRDEVTQTLQRYAISLNAQQRQSAKNFLDGEFRRADIVDWNRDGVPDYPADTTRIRDYHFLWGNCATTTTSALPAWASLGVPVLGSFSPNHLGASLALQSLLPWSKIRRLVDKVY